jgi:hypothetical protein
MRKISTSTMAAFVMLALASTATAGDDKGQGAPAAKPAAKPVVKPTAKKQAEPAMIKPKEPAPAPTPTTDAMPPPKPAPELVAAVKAQKGTWFCTGQEFGPDGVAMKTKATMRNTVDLDKMWIKSALTIPKKKGQKRATKYTSYKTFDAVTKKWSSVSVDNSGGWSKAWSTGPDAAGKTTWEVEGNMGAMTFKGRDYEEPGAKKGTIHVWGEWSPDGGKNYVKAYDVTCRK